LAYGGGGGGGGGAQADANETIYFILFICKCFNNKGVTVCNWCYNCWNNPTNKQGLAPKERLKSTLILTPLKRGVDFANRTFNTKEYNTNPIVNHIGFIYIYIYIYIYI
jgi:hypothetical protein